LSKVSTIPISIRSQKVTAIVLPTLLSIDFADVISELHLLTFPVRIKTTFVMTDKHDKAIKNTHSLLDDY